MNGSLISPERVVTLVMTSVVGLTFLFGFGNVWHLALALGVPGYVAPLIAPAVDVSVLGLIVGTRHLALHGAAELQLRPARVLLLCTSAATLALNVAGPVAGGRWGSAAGTSVKSVVAKFSVKVLLADWSAELATVSTTCGGRRAFAVLSSS